MTKQEIIELIETTLNNKMKKNENYIKYSFFEVNVKYKLSEEDKKVFLELLKIKLENNNYNVYREGQQFEYNDEKITVQNNEELIAIKNNM